MKLNLKLIKFEEKKNIIYFEMNNIEYYYNTKNQFIYKAETKNKYVYDSKFDPKIKKLIKERYESYKNYNKKIEEL